MIYFAFAFTSWLIGAFDMITGNCAQSVVPRHGEELNSLGLLRCLCWSIVRMWLVYYKSERRFIEMRLF